MTLLKQVGSGLIHPYITCSFRIEKDITCVCLTVTGNVSGLCFLLVCLLIKLYTKGSTKNLLNLKGKSNRTGWKSDGRKVENVTGTRYYLPLT